MAPTDVWKTVQASWVEGRLENVIERKKQLAALHGNLTRLQKKDGLDSKFGALKELDFIISVVAELHNSLDIHATQNTEKSLAVGNKATTLLRPLGVALIIGSEAAPLSSCLLPFAAALAAGCPTVVAAPGSNKQAVSYLREILGSGIDGEACVVTVIDGQDDEIVWTRLHFDVASIPDSDPESTVAKALRQANPFIRILQPLPGHRIAVVDRSAANLDQIAAQLSRAATSHRTSIPKIMLVDEFTTQALEASLSSFASRSEAKSSFVEILSGVGAAKDSSSFALKLTGNEFGEAIELLFIPTTSMEDSISLVEKM
ncbi:Beta-apo-4'-carotenal oxygenase [Lasiodiplodia theobromae]|uniref:Beta-apo-4'-carotenal oxygenase n=1 Tax=Lasiodiplodia theobromae TaxID=45133 RepID=A0A5N5CUT9_9PEZI|nr:Beta-apo-4'-carotenal oxygenase [Lasiodiplodia theobromae]